MRYVEVGDRRYEGMEQPSRLKYRTVSCSIEGQRMWMCAVKEGSVLLEELHFFETEHFAFPRSY